MDLSYGITSKLLIWFGIIVTIFYGTILVLFINVQQVVKLSENIVGKNYAISSISKKMIENLLNMEESEKKYGLLQKDDYLTYFVAQQFEFETNLVKILDLESKGLAIPTQWHDVYETYQQFPAAADKNALLKAKPSSDREAGKMWIPEAVINTWIEKITQAQVENAIEVEASTRELNLKGRVSARNGLIGLGVSSLVGLIGIIFLAYSMIRPLRELIRGIRSISKNRDNPPIRIRSKDEFGELAGAFNEMTTLLRREERMRSDFISMLSHEIRTPLTSIRESVNMIGEEVMGPINQRQRKFLEIASSEIGRICDLLNHLMQASRLEPGRLEIHALAVDPLELVAGSVNSLKPAAENKKIKVHTQIQQGIAHVLGDPKQLQQVLMNLLSNAIKFSEPNSEVVVRVEQDINSAMLKFCVSDNGPGILEEEQTLLFNKYYRAESVRDHMDGVGLGLSIAKNIVEAHNGSVWVDSQFGHGSTFGFTLPMATNNGMR
jgi:signal transduction histidine kinase